MNEEAIVQSLKARIPRADFPVEPTKSQEEVAPIVQQVVAAGINTDTIPNEIAAWKLIDSMGLDRSLIKDRTALEKLNAIYDWASSKCRSEDSVDVMNEIRTLEGQLGLQFRIGDKLERLYRWVKLDGQRRKIEKELQIG